MAYPCSFHQPKADTKFFEMHNLRQDNLILDNLNVIMTMLSRHFVERSMQYLAEMADLDQRKSSCN